MAATLRAYLVLDVRGSGSGCDHLADGSSDVEGSAPSRVDIDKKRQGACASDAPNVGEHVFHGADAEVGNPQRIGSDTAAGKINCAKTGGLGQQRNIGVNRSNH